MPDTTRPAGIRHRVPPPTPEARRRGPKIAKEERLRFYQRAIRELGHDLSAREWRLYLTLIDATVGWGEWSGTLTEAQLLDGVPGAVGGVGMSDTTMWRARIALAEKGLIKFERRANDGLVYTVIADTKPRSRKRRRRA